MSDAKLSSRAWCVFSLCLALAFIKSKQRGGRNTSNEPRTGDDRHTENTTGRRGTSRAVNDDGFKLYDEAAADEREALAPPMELSDDVLAMLSSFDVDPVRGVPIAHYLFCCGTLRFVVRQPWSGAARSCRSLKLTGILNVSRRMPLLPCCSKFSPVCV